MRVERVFACELFCGPVWIALRLGDHLAYSAGVWVGAVTERRPGVLLPKVVELDRRN